MSEVTVPFGDDASETATLLLAAAEELDQDPTVVRTSSDATFLVPEEIAKKAGVKYESEEAEESPKPAKKSAAKKAAKKSE